MKTRSLTATKLRLALVGALVLLAAIGTTIFIVGYNSLADFAVETSATATKAAESNRKVQELTITKRQLQENEKAIERASRIVAESKGYIYQEVIIEDLNRIAQQSGFQILGITFGDTTTTGAAAPTATAAPAGQSAAPLAGGVKSITATVRISEKVEYKEMVKFLYAIEQNLTKMSISKVTLSSNLEDGGGLSSKVLTDELQMEVYVR
jgi:hypothetical protein